MDLRVPSGWFFALVGLILLILGIASPGSAPLLEINLNLIMGIVLLLFGGTFIWISRKKA